MSTVPDSATDTALTEFRRQVLNWTPPGNVPLPQNSDGDTIDVTEANGTNERIRILGIDTPEQGECGYQEAAACLAQLIPAGTTITAATDPSQAERDVAQRPTQVAGVQNPLSAGGPVNLG